MKSEEKTGQELIKRRGRGKTRISRDQSVALPRIKQALTDAGLSFADSYIYRVLAGTHYNFHILSIANPIVEQVSKERAKLEAQRNKHLSANGNA